MNPGSEAASSGLPGSLSQPELPIEEPSHVAIESRLASIWRTKPGAFGWFGTVDHKTIGKRYIVTALAFLFIGFAEALTMRAQLAQANQRIVSPEVYNQIFTMHSMTMIFWYASPILSGFANYLVPLMLGARDMSFPRLNAFTYWTFLFSGLFLYLGIPLGQMPHAGWFAYAPYTLSRFSPSLGMDLYALSLIFLTISTTAGAINFIVTISRHRAPGMSLSRMPLFMYSTGTTAVISVFALPALTVACVLLELERRYGFHFFLTRQGGDPLLWQQLFWFFGHPWVYIVFLPATGMVSMLLPVFARRPIVGYTYVALATVLTGAVGFAVWLHHMFATGINHGSMSFFSAASMTISVFSTVQVLAWIATLWRGRPVLTTSMWFALGFIANFIIGGLNGVIVAIIPFDWQVHDTYFVVAHLHYVLIGANVFPVFAALYYWYPKMTGRILDERLGKASFWLMFLGFNLGFFPMHVLGVLGMPRRIFTYPDSKHWSNLNAIVSLGAVVLVVGALVSVYNFWLSHRSGKRAGKNPWNADGLEWSTESPPKVYGSVHIPTVVSRHPLWDEHEEEKDTSNERVLAEGRLTLSTSIVDARPLAVARMPEDSLSPLMAGLVLTVFFTALLFDRLWLALGAALAFALVCAAWLWPEDKPKEAVTRHSVEAKKAPKPIVGKMDDRRGTRGMWWFIATELTLFVCLFFAYFYLGPYPTEDPPKLGFALCMFGVLLLSSLVLHWGERRVEARPAAARIALGSTILLGVGFLVLQVLEYREHLKKLTPQSNSYGSIFYTITSFHALHLVVGLLMLIYVLLLPELRTRPEAPQQHYKNAARYWHFVDAVWAFIVLVLYVIPNFFGSVQPRDVAILSGVPHVASESAVALQLERVR